MNQSEVQHLAAIGSPTAKSLMAQMEAEARQAEAHKEALAQARKQEDSTERSQRIKDLQGQIDEGLALYEKHRKLAQDGLNEAFAASFKLPFGALPRHPFDFLKKANMPTTTPRPGDELWPVFSTTEQFIFSVINPR